MRTYHASDSLSSSFRDFHGDDKGPRFRFRLIVTVVLVLAAFGVLFARFFWLQILRHDYYSTRAEDNRITLVPIVPSRGTIADRNGIVLARNYSAFTLEIDPERAGNIDETIDELAELIEITDQDRRRFKKLQGEAKNFESLQLRSRLRDEEVAIIAVNRYRLPGVEIRARLFREYPLGSLAVHALGYIGREREADRAWIEERDPGGEQIGNYRGTRHIGQNGLERHYEFQLHGKAGHEELEVDRFGRAVRRLSIVPPVQGATLTLTLDVRLQEVAERAFADRRGALVAIDPSTGGILALVSMPTYDPNLFVDGIRSEEWDALNNDPDLPMYNRAIQSAYPPGSTFKPFMALAALETGKRTPQQAISDPGYFEFGGNRFRDDKAGGHGSVDMHKSIVQSCDTYYYQLANDMGIDAIANFMRPLGFGQKTGIDLENENEGVLPSPEWKKKRFRKPEQQKWFAGETISIGIGQGYNSYTPLQLALATATIANNGVMFRPHLVRYITDSRTGARTMIEPQPVRALPLKPGNIEVIRRAMVEVNKTGTGARAFAGVPYTVAGKTGTAQVYSLRGSAYSANRVKEHLRDHALYIAFAPAEDPKIALAVLVENGGFGAQSAAPIVRMVLDHYLLGQTASGPAPEDPGAVDSDAPAETGEENAPALELPAEDEASSPVEPVETASP
ncbi:MAG: penicillin-binding protein 2 [Betaproteobacteria bacterium]|nr:penicillin-binding protein 2 [Betaproteobacteria bacterium]